MTEKEPASQELVRRVSTDLTLASTELVRRGLDLALHLSGSQADSELKAILCIGDQHLFSLVSRHLEMFGYTVTQTDSGGMLAACGKVRFNLIVSDSTPDGLTAAEQAHRRYPAIPPLIAKPFEGGMFLTGPPFEIRVECDIDTGHYRALSDSVEAPPDPSIGRNYEHWKRVLYCDPLTDTHNARFFEMRIVEELERALRFNGKVSLIIADIDFFQSLNDEFGHEAGDEVLRSVATILRRSVRKMDMVCRYNNDDFVILIPETTGENALRVAEKLRRQIETHDFPGVPRPVTISCGVADYPNRGTTRDELVRGADAALASAKSVGRNRVALAEWSKDTSRT